jgi:methionine synthase I (cobalamin-dependent)/5,10-methylenetetrahydrofolate reductase
MDRAAFRALLAEGPLLGDGGTGTSLVALGVPPEACFEELNLSRPDLVARVHHAFLEAGARFVETNTWGANRPKLAREGLAGRVRELNLAGARIAREAGAPLVAGSVGPLGVRLAPYGRVQPDEAREAFAEQIAALVEGGVDFLCLETHSDLAEVLCAIEAARSVAPDLPVLASFTYTPDDRTPLGDTPEAVARRLARAEVDAVGVNCSQGPAQVLRIVTAMRPHAGGLPLAAMPNAGGPTRVGGRILYPATPEYFAEHATAFLDAGVAILGGCCGTGPEHISAMARAVAAPRPAPAVRIEAAPEERPERPAAPAPATELARRLAAGRFVVNVEMDPPRGASAARMLAAAETLAEAGADTISVADSPMARMRMSPWAACHLIQQEAGIETILHFPTRGRNLLRVQGDLLAAHALGIRNVFAVMGDPTALGDYPEATDSVDLLPSGLIALIKRSFNVGLDRTGASIGEATAFVVGCAVNLNAPDLAREARTLRRKVLAGADFALSQPVFDRGRLEELRRAYEKRWEEPLTLPVLVGLLPLRTARHAEFLHNEVPGIDVPEAVRERMRRAADPHGEGLAIATELAAELRETAAGIYLIPPFERYDVAAELVERIRAARAA